jgi:hypothetical protein
MNMWQKRLIGSKNGCLFICFGLKKIANCIILVLQNTKRGYCMKLTFLGTGAADWNWRDHHEDPEYRRNSALLIDDCLLIDPGPDVPDALATFGKTPERIRYIINTHKHRDHFNEGTVAFLGGAELYPLAAGETKAIGTYTVTALAANHATCAGAVHFIMVIVSRNSMISRCFDTISLILCQIFYKNLD